ncbi:MAG: DUF805 domain-containing protein [Phenylobacterium sp.]|uniref:DUF805 domain-containing protein n=1 Tax=Phenylobacterium sp. TaxID=1871053 RepID=UPI002733FE4F|nr:DUF805 domain-containing protein [Phenylobacterium sp.]MDP3175689.1 DUF805 domain-containing protein [Phenylobacterium sp.]
MSLETLLLTPSGRIGRKSFWRGYLFLILAAFLISIPISVWTAWALDNMPKEDAEMRSNLMSWAAQAALFYPGLCLTVKRLHDHGRTGWWYVVPTVVMVVTIGLAVMIGGPEVLSKDAPAGPSPALGILMGGMLIALTMMVTMLIYLGALPGEKDANRFGPPEAPPEPTRP